MHHKAVTAITVREGAAEEQRLDEADDSPLALKTASARIIAGAELVAVALAGTAERVRFLPAFLSASLAPGSGGADHRGREGRGGDS